MPFRVERREKPARKQKDSRRFGYGMANPR